MRLLTWDPAATRPSDQPNGLINKQADGLAVAGVACSMHHLVLHQQLGKPRLEML